MDDATRLDELLDPQPLRAAIIAAVAAYPAIVGPAAGVAEVAELQVAAPGRPPVDHVVELLRRRAGRPGVPAPVAAVSRALASAVFRRAYLTPLFAEGGEGRIDQERLRPGLPERWARLVTWRETPEALYLMARLGLTTRVGRVESLSARSASPGCRSGSTSART